MSMQKARAALAAVLSFAALSLSPAATAAVIFDNAEWVIETLDTGIAELPYVITVNGVPAGSSKLLAFASRVPGTNSYPQVFVLYSSGYMRAKAAADVPFGQSLVLGPGIWGSSASVPSSTLLFNPQLASVDIDTSQLAADGTGTVFVRAAAPASAVPSGAPRTNRVMNQTWTILLREPTASAARVDITGRYTFTEAFLPDPTRSAELQSMRLVQISSMYLDALRHDVDGLLARTASGDRLVDYGAAPQGQLLPADPVALDAQITVFDSLHSDDAGDPNGNTPTYKVLLARTEGVVSGPAYARAFITPSDNPNDDNLGVWLHQSPPAAIAAGSGGSFAYTLIASTDPQPEPADTTLFAAVLPSSRSVAVGVTATAFATIINAGASEALNCAPSLPPGIDADFAFQQTDPATNLPIGIPNAGVDIPPHSAARTFVFAITPRTPLAPTDLALRMDCANTRGASSDVGLNTLLLSASTTPVPDVIALAATTTGDGILNIPGPAGSHAFAVASANVGATGSITVAADTGGVALPVSILVCRTDSLSICQSPPAPSVTTTIAAGDTPTFGIFVSGTGTPVNFNPAASRIYVRFKQDGVTRGSTSVAVTTQ